MKRLLSSLAFAVGLSTNFSSVASQEGLLALGEFRLASPGIGGSGPVVVQGMQSAERFVSLTVSAFGHNTSLSAEQLAQLAGGFINGLQVSFEAGYRELDGRTVYLVLSRGFTSGLQSTQLISVNEQGTVKVNAAISK